MVVISKSVPGTIVTYQVHDVGESAEPRYHGQWGPQEGGHGAPRRAGRISLHDIMEGLSSVGSHTD